ncbi:MAG: hypothetical protein KIS97_05060 [Nitrospira sp.]|nr:hypothetical protein [Nitrospira sp.]
MALLLPPIVYGPITTGSTHVRVVAGMAGRTIIVYDEQIEIGRLETNETKEYWVPLQAKPLLGHNITARIASGKPPVDFSQPSVRPVPVIDIPNPLSTPIILSDLNTCITDIFVDGLVPGATVITTIGGQLFGSAQTYQPRTWLGIDRSKGITPGSKVTIHQEIRVGTELRKSASVESPAIPELLIKNKIMPPPTLGPLAACDTDRIFLLTVPGAEIVLQNAGRSEAVISPTTTFMAHGGLSLLGTEAVVTQSLQRCGHQSDPITLPINPPIKSRTPTVAHKLCPDIMRLLISNLEPGGLLYVYQRVTDPSGMNLDTLLGSMGIASETQPVDLPNDTSLVHPDGVVSIRIDQQRCDGTSDPAIAQVAQAAGPFDPPRFGTAPLDCQQFLHLIDTHPGAMVQAFDEESQKNISDEILVPSRAFPLWLYFPLTAGKKIFVEQKGCNANGKVRATVGALPQPLPVPKIVRPVRPNAQQIEVTEIVPCAKLYLYVNNKLRPGSLIALAPTARINVLRDVSDAGDGLTLVEDDLVHVTQTLCDRTSPYTGHGVPVERGRMNLSVNHSEMTRGKSYQVLVNATDKETNLPVMGSVWFNGLRVGQTGSYFTYQSKLGDPNPVGLVKEPIAYFEEPFAINLVDPKVDPTKGASWNLRLTAGPLKLFFGSSLSFDITEVSWRITADWDTSLLKDVQGTLTGGSATAMVSLPRPTGTNKIFKVQIGGKGSTKGGNFEGYQVDKKDVTIQAITQLIGFDGGDLAAGWGLGVKAPSDGFNGIWWFEANSAGVEDL